MFFFIFSFLAFVSGFNKRCFLRRRCSMGMWCLYDIGRDSWDWVGPRAWGRACFNSPEWGGGSSLVKTEPLQIVLLLLLLVVVCCGCGCGCVLLCCVFCVVSLIFDACDVTTKLAPDAPSPRRILTQNRLLQKLYTPQQTQPPPRVAPSSMNSGAVFMHRPPYPTSPPGAVRSARCCSRSLFTLLHTRRVHRKTRSSVPSTKWEALPTSSLTRSRAPPQLTSLNVTVSFSTSPSHVVRTSFS